MQTPPPIFEDARKSKTSAKSHPEDAQQSFIRPSRGGNWIKLALLALAGAGVMFLYDHCSKQVTHPVKKPSASDYVPFSPAGPLGPRSVVAIKPGSFYGHWGTHGLDGKRGNFPIGEKGCVTFDYDNVAKILINRGREIDFVHADDFAPDRNGEQTCNANIGAVRATAMAGTRRLMNSQVTPTHH